jgi:formate dehydrogenase subunit gamma
VATPDLAFDQARFTEDSVVGDVIIRHRLSTRVMHWAVAVCFFLSLVSGAPIWSPVFGWMANLLGGLSACRVIHPWAGLLFVVGSVFMYVRWRGEMRIAPQDRAWFGLKSVRYMDHKELDVEVGKYNGGQKLFFYAAALGALGLLVSGVVLWLPTRFPALVRWAGILLHDITFILFAVAIVFHIYLAAVAEPRTLRAMTRGTVTKGWARLHHPGWYREVVEGQRPRD